VADVLKGLPQWNETEVPASVPDVSLAFLIQASWEDQLPMLRRTFDRLYSPKDIFLYFVDRQKLDVAKVFNTLPHPLPNNVLVKPMPHAEYYVWPRVEIVLDGLRTLLQHPHSWDFVIHLSESDYPVHSMWWIRQSLAMQRRTNFVQLIPRCVDASLGPSHDPWYWWTQTGAMASCGTEIEATTVDGVTFPMNQLEAKASASPMARSG